MGKPIDLWTIVQHSGYGYANKPGFERGLETRHITTATERNTVKKAGGLLLDSYVEAEALAMEQMYPEDGSGGLYPLAGGSFSTVQIDSLAIWLPPRDVAAIRELVAMREELAR